MKPFSENILFNKIRLERNKTMKKQLCKPTSSPENTRKLTESIGQLSDHFIEEVLETPVKQKKKKDSNFSSFHIPHQLTAAIAMLCISIGIIFAVQYIIPDYLPEVNINSQKFSASLKQNGIFSSFSVIAYAAEKPEGSTEKSIILEENVPTILSQYSPLMSSVPAMPFSFSYHGEAAAKNIHFVISSDNKGILQKYKQSDIWDLVEEGFSLQCKNNEKIYWKPSDSFQCGDNNSKEQTKDAKDGLPLDLPEDHEKEISEDETDPANSLEKDLIDSDQLGADSLITVHVYADEELLETQYIGISYQDSHYTATLKLNVYIQ